MEDIEDNEKIFLNKLNNLQKKIIELLNVQLKIKLTGKEIKIDLNNKNIGNIEFNLLSCMEFNNLEELNLSHNSISDLGSLKYFNIPKIKKLDLSFNKIINNKKKLDLSFNKIINNKKKLELSLFNSIFSKKSVNITLIENELDKKSKLFRSELDLDNNNLITKDIKEIKMQIINNYQLNKKINNDNKNNFSISLLNKLNRLEKNVIEFLNVKLNMNLTREEIIIDLNNKNIYNIDLDLFSCAEFKNLEEINLSHNKIYNIEFFKYFKLPNLKKLDLSFKVKYISFFERNKFR